MCHVRETEMDALDRYLDHSFWYEMIINKSWKIWRPIKKMQALTNADTLFTKLQRDVCLNVHYMHAQKFDFP